MSKTSKPHVKAAEIEKQAVRALSEKEIDEALMASTFGGADAKRVKDLEKDIEVLRAECLDLRNENRRLKESIDETNGQLRVRERELDEMKKTNSKMKYAHEEEVRALEDELTEAKILNKKNGEYCSMLDEDSDAFEKILELAKVIHGLAKSTESISLLIKDEVEGHI